MTTPLPTIAWRLMAILIVTYLFITTKTYHEIPFVQKSSPDDSQATNNNAPAMYLSDNIPGIVELTDENWSQYTSKQMGKPILVLLYDSSCAWSALLTPIMRHVASLVQSFNQRRFYPTFQNSTQHYDNGDSLIIAKMNIRVGYVFSIVAKLGIRAYPSILLFLPGQNREMATTLLSIAENQIAEHQDTSTPQIRRRPKTVEYVYNYNTFLPNYFFF